eukprot:TRINITY_DN49166_c0_g1_i2.p2 TRINITY_DN49166_c0_g1~~TRINITY_DN49166_c0_g1_i2.p2  ORF type:complete len:276 (-),score=83.80 TRINITY_DN49166_c0_g1_i2:78-905(-)
MIRRPPRSTLSSSSAASDVYKRQVSTQSTGKPHCSDMLGATYTAARASFDSMGSMIAALTFVPAPGMHNLSSTNDQQGNPLFPGVIVLGPVASIKEQAPLQYATRLCSRGFSSMVFDCRTYGESEGEPRRREDGDMKVADVKAAVGFMLDTLPVDPNKLYLLGICQGVNWVLRAATLDDRIKAISLVAGNYLTPEVSKMIVGPGQYEQRITESKASQDKFDQEGQVDYLPVVKSNPDEEALLGLSLIHISEPTRLLSISYAVFCLKKKKKKNRTT